MLTYSYIAGLFDAEGSINIYEKKKKSTGVSCFYLNCSITNTNLEVIERSKEVIGGYISRYTPLNKKHKVVYKNRLSCKKAFFFLKNIENFVIIKKEQVALAIEFQNITNNKSNHKLKKNEYDKKQEIKIKISKINKKHGYQKNILSLKNMIQEEQKSYIAGLFDGDGCITIRKYFPKKMKSPSYCAHISLINCNKSILLFLKKQFGGCVTLLSRNKNPLWNNCYQLQISSDKGINFIKFFYNFLVIKQEQASLIIEFQKEIRSIGRKYGVKGLPVNVLLSREKYKKQLSLLKRNDNKVCLINN